MANLPHRLYFPVVSCLWLVICCFGCGDITGEVVSLSVSPSSVTLGINKTQLFSATVKDSVGKFATVSPTWSVSGSIGSISSTGLLTAGTSDATGEVVATYSSFTAEAAVTVTTKGWVKGTVFSSKGNKVEGIKVYLKGYESTLLDFTSSIGSYSIDNVPAATYEVWTTEISSTFRAASKEVTVASGETVTQNFTILYFTDPPDLSPPSYTP